MLLHMEILLTFDRQPSKIFLSSYSTLLKCFKYQKMHGQKKFGIENTLFCHHPMKLVVEIRVVKLLLVEIGE